MAKIKIDWMENKLSKENKPYIKASVTDESGQSYKDVAIFSGFSGFSEIRPGSIVEGIVKSKMYNGKISYSLENKTMYDDLSGGTAAPGYRKTAPMTAMIEKKQEGITHAQENKAEGIKISSTIRMAVDIVISEGGSDTMTAEQTQARIKYWREWLWLHWDAKDGDFKPF